MLEMLKNIFPKPNIPQKRYLIIAAVIIYGIVKLYVISTPTHDDDKLLNQIQGIVLQLANQNMPNSGECSKCYDGEESSS